MKELRSTQERKADVLAALERNGEMWLATASPPARPHIIAVSSWWDGSHVVMATTAESRTAKNLSASGVGRLALGSPEDVILLDVTVAETVPVSEADSELSAGFEAAAGWNPAEEGESWQFFRLLPVQVQAYRGYGELQGRPVMRNSKWLG